MKRIAIITGLVLFIGFIYGINVTNRSKAVNTHKPESPVTDKMQFVDFDLSKSAQTGRLSRPVSPALSRMANCPVDRRYSFNHLWVYAIGGYCVIGITDWGQENLGDIVYADIYEVGEWVAEGEEFGFLESVASVFPLFMPISGTILEVNPDLQEKPQILNSKPHQISIIRVKLDDSSSFDNLLDGNTYSAIISE